MASMVDAGGKLNVSVRQDESLCVRRDRPIQANAGTRVGPCIPAFASAALARLQSGNYYMQRVSASGPDESSVTISCPGGKQLIAIGLSAGEQLAVSFAHVIGHTQQMRFQTFANLSVAAFACDRNFITIADGPGTIYVESNGNHSVYRTGETVFNPNQLIAWDPKLRFKLDRVHDVAELYLNSIRVSCKMDPDFVPLLVDSMPMVGPVASNPLLSILKSIYWPRFH